MPSFERSNSPGLPRTASPKGQAARGPDVERMTEALSRLLASASSEIRAQGETLAREERVNARAMQERSAAAEVIGFDGASFDVTLDWDGSAPDASCSCPEWGSREDQCRHVMALASYLLERYAPASDRPSASLPPALLAPQAPRPSESAEAVRAWLGLPSLPHRYHYELEPIAGGLSVGVVRVEPPQASNAQRFVSAAALQSSSSLRPGDRRLFSLLAPLPRATDGRHHVPAPLAGCVLEAMRGRDAWFSGVPLRFGDVGAQLVAESKNDERRRSLALRLRMPDGALAPLESVRFFGAVPVYALVVDQAGLLLRLETAIPLEQLGRFQANPELRVASGEESALDQAMAGLARMGVGVEGEGEAPLLSPQFALTLEGGSEQVSARLSVRYGELTLSVALAPPALHIAADGRIVRRDQERELAAVEALLHAGLASGPQGTFRAQGDRAVDFWLHGFRTLPPEWEYFRPKESELRLRPLSTKLQVKGRAGGWFDLELSFAHEDQSVDLERVRTLLAQNRRYVKLQDGSMGELPKDVAAQLKALLEEAEVKGEGAKLALRAEEAGALSELLELIPEAKLEAAAEKLLAALKGEQGPERVAIPKGLAAELRPYQREGLDWLALLHSHSLCGVLADDMGLGKTVQALALLMHVKQREGGAPNLVVAPTSVLPNWVRETERFTRGLKILMHEGPGREQVSPEQFGQYDLVVTSYALLRRDVELLRQVRFRYVILDEAQHVKNPASLGARAARALQCDRRLVLTGTPLENRLGDLWSLFHFLMPGLLGSEEGFRRRYARPIEADGNQLQRERLRRRVRPFILRRLKEEVARDLPPRTETLLPVELSPGQQALYAELLETARDRVFGIIDRVGFAKARVSVLAELLRLRQVCIDPRLLKLPPGTRLPPSAKLTAFAELVRELIEEGHRALVFSQFTEMLDHLVAWAQEEKLDFEYLSGETKNRQERVDRFNAPGGPPLFFVSLKAGGVGLNLTGADYVIHYDPWWNPAVEQQATDRAHRIGQTRPVFSYKLVAKGTVEEKIVAMQERKRSLAAKILDDEELFGQVIGEAEVREFFA